MRMTSFKIILQKKLNIKYTFYIYYRVYFILPIYHIVCLLCTDSA